MGISVNVTVDDGGQRPYKKRISMQDLGLAGDASVKPSRERIIDVVDGACDLRYVTTGTLVAFGVPDLHVQREVDQNNMLKFRPGHSFREDGKLIKPADHPVPTENLLNIVFPESASQDAGSVKAQDLYVGSLPIGTTVATTD